jgi:hypothetical protein
MAGMDRKGALFGGLVLLGAAVYGTVTGKYHGKFGGITKREDNPVYFWFITIAFYLLGSFLIFIGV